jgi:hypothetical protein
LPQVHYSRHEHWFANVRCRCSPDMRQQPARDLPREEERSRLVIANWECIDAVASGVRPPPIKNPLFEFEL